MSIRIAFFSLLAVLSACGPTAENVMEGQLFPALELQAVDGKRLEKFQVSGRPMVLNVWATWCAPCRAEMASLNRLHRDYEGQGLAVVGISIDRDRYMVSEYLRTGAVDFPVLIDPSGEQIQSILSTPAVPVTVLVDRYGKIRKLLVGEKDWDSPVNRQWVERLMFN